MPSMKQLLIKERLIMKKFLIYLIVFISLFIGTASCVVAIGYNDYLNKKNEPIESLSTQEETILTKLANNVITSENYTGKILFSSDDKSTSLTGSFSYNNTDSISAYISICGQVEAFNVELDLLMIGDNIFIDFNGIKLKVSSTALLESFNEVISFINSKQSTQMPKIDMSALQDVLSEIKTSETDFGYNVNADIPSLCAISIITNKDFIPKQISVSNLTLGNEVYGLIITADQTAGQFPKINESDYLDISNALSYVSPILNTLSQDNIIINGTLTMGSLDVKTQIYINKNVITGIVNLYGIDVKFKYEDNFFYLDFLNNCYKLSSKEITTLLTTDLGLKTTSTFKITDTLSNNITKDTNILINVNKNNVIDKFYFNYDKISFDATIGKTLFNAPQISSKNYKTYTDVSNFISKFKGIIATKYSIDIEGTYMNSHIEGKAFVGSKGNLTDIDTFYFDGKIGSLKSIIVYENGTAYLDINNSKIVLSNTTINGIIKNIGEIIKNNLWTTSKVPDLSNLNPTLTSINTRKIQICANDLSISLTSYNPKFIVDISSNNLNFNINILANSTSCQKISQKINKSSFTNIDNSQELTNSLKNTLNCNNYSYNGTLSLDILGIAFADIDINVSKKNNKTTIILDNIPSTAAITNYNSIIYNNQSCKIEIAGNMMHIYRTISYRLTNKTIVACDKSISLSSLNVSILQDILGLKSSITKKLNSNNNSGILTNLSTDCINVLKTHTNIRFCSDMITSAELILDYEQFITNISANIKLYNSIYCNFKLTKNN